MSTDFTDDTSICPYCAETIKAQAVKCRYCGEFLDGSLQTDQSNNREYRVNYSFTPGLAFVLGLLVTGFGQIYQGRAMIGLAYLAITGILTLTVLFVSPYILIILWIYHFWVAFDAYRFRPTATLQSAEVIPQY